jgi:3D (Asp-Asp-Asp) domain-containing protein
MARRKRHFRWSRIRILLIVILLAWLAFEGRFYIPRHIRPPAGVQPIEVVMETTSYCHCGKCCSYSRFLFIPYQKTGTFSFRLKHVGVTSSGATVRPGTIAADTSIYPYGTVMYIPGYGYGVVEDTGGAIKGQHIDLYRPNHWYARHWGVQTKKVKVWLPDKSGPESVSPSDALPVALPDEGTPETGRPPPTVTNAASASSDTGTQAESIPSGGMEE